MTLKSEKFLPIKVLKGPRQVGKTSLIERLGNRLVLSFDDFQTRQRAQDNPRLFLDQFIAQPLLLDEATLAPALFPELKRRVDDSRRARGKPGVSSPVDVWITGSNQTLLEKAVQESLAGRASYFDLNTLSLHEIGPTDLSQPMLRGGWPELYASPALDPVSYLNDLISTFIEKDIVAAAGIERKSAFSKMLALLAGRVGQLINAADIARNVGVETTTIQSWVGKLEQNALVRTLPPYFSNLNQRLIKTPKIYFEDVGLASRLQGWADFGPLYVSPAFGHLVENLAVAEIARFFVNRGEKPRLHFLRSKEKVEVDLLVQLPNDRWLAIEIKSSPVDFTAQQMALLETTKLNVLERWITTPGSDTLPLRNARVIPFSSLWDELTRLVCRVD